MRLLLDEQISGKVAEHLRKRNCDAIAVAEEVAMRGLSDPDVFDVAQAQGRMVVTYNRADFEAINLQYAETNRDHYGLVIVHPVRFPSRDFARLARALKGLVDGEARGNSFTAWLQET